METYPKKNTKKQKNARRCKLGVSSPVPPAIIPTCLNFRILGSDFLSGRMANFPANISKSVYLPFYNINKYINTNKKHVVRTSQIKL